MTNHPPNDVRFFVHKRIGGAIKGFIGSGFNPIAAASGFFQATDRGTARGRAPRQVAICGGKQCGATSMVDPRTCNCVPRSSFSGLTTAPPRNLARERAQRFSSFGGDCLIPGQRLDENGNCRFFLGDQPGRDDTPTGDAVMGRYGAGLVPGTHVINRAVCLRGMVLGNDGLCYNKSQISNKEREWPRGRRPLLTGGDMRAISTAARAGRRLEGATKRLQKIGLMKKPAPRRSSVSARQEALAIRHHNQ